MIFYTLVILGCAALGVMALRRMKKRGARKDNLLEGEDEAYSDACFDQEYVGKFGVVVTDLKPAGQIEVGNQRVQAIAKASYILKGGKIKVVGGSGVYLIVDEDIG